MLGRYSSWMRGWFHTKRKITPELLMSRLLVELKRANQHSEKLQRHWVSLQKRHEKREAFDLKKEKRRRVSERRIRNRLSEKVSDELDETRGLQSQYEEALEAANSKMKIQDEITIPGLVSSSKLLLKRTEADIANEVRRQAGYTSPEELR